MLKDETTTIVDTEVHKLSEFEFQQHATYTLLSSRKSGKSYLVKNLVYLLFKRKLTDIVYIISFTAHVDKNYSWIPREYVIHPSKQDQFI